MFLNNQDRIISEIQDHAYNEFPNECCGILIKEHGGFRYIPCENLSESPQTSFKIDPVRVASVYDQIECIVHSHPNTTARPSNADIRMSDEMKKPLLIISIPSNTFLGYNPISVISDLFNREFVYALNDCVTLVRDFYRTKMNIQFEDPVRRPYGWWNEESEGDDKYLINQFKRVGFKEVDYPQYGDLVVIRFGKKSPSHVAVYIDDNKIAHNKIGSRSCIENYDLIYRKNTICYLSINERN